jgi:hypothetical protein
MRLNLHHTPKASQLDDFFHNFFPALVVSHHNFFKNSTPSYFIFYLCWTYCLSCDADDDDDNNDGNMVMMGYFNGNFFIILFSSFCDSLKIFFHALLWFFFHCIIKAGKYRKFLMRFAIVFWTCWMWFVTFGLNLV